MIYDSLGPLSNPRVTSDSSSLMISDSLGRSSLSNPRVTYDRSSLTIYDSMDLCVLSNQRVTRDSSSLVISESLEGSMGCRIHASPAKAVHFLFLTP